MPFFTYAYVCASCLQEWEKTLDEEEIFLPKEPPLDDENAITIVVRMPDGSRRGRRFLKTDKLQVYYCQNLKAAKV